MRRAITYFADLFCQRCAVIDRTYSSVRILRAVGAVCDRACPEKSAKYVIALEKEGWSLINDP